MVIQYMERYRVGFGRTGSTLVLVHFGIHKIYYLVYSALFTITVAHLPAIQIHYNVNDDTRLHADVNVDWTYGTVFRLLWTNREYVVIGACSNSNVSLLGIWCTMAPSPLNTHLLFNYTTITMTWMYGAVVAQEVRWHWCTFTFEYVIAWVTSHHCNHTLAWYSHTLQKWWCHTALCWWCY